MTLTQDMKEALADLDVWPARSRGPSNTGLHRNTYKALERRGLVEVSSVETYRLTDAGRSALASATVKAAKAAMSPTMRDALADWQKGSGAPKYKGVRWQTAKALVDRELLQTASGLRFVGVHMALVITPEGERALRQRTKQK